MKILYIVMKVVVLGVLWLVAQTDCAMSLPLSGNGVAVIH